MLSFTRRRSEREAFLQKIRALEEKLKIATLCLTKISEGDQSLSYFDVQLSETTEEEKHFAKTLQKTKDRLAQYNQQEQQRAWAAKGMNQYLEVIQGDRGDKDFYDKVLTMIVRYTQANQGGIFLLNDQNPEDQHLALKACYAYNKKKFIDRKIGIGQGMIGQAFLEKETSIFLSVPENYFHITSGLGEATPRFLLMTPLKYDQHVVGVLEIGAFQKMEKHHVIFIEKIAENLASVILNIQHADKATAMYEESRERATMLLEKEEILKQSIEELEATQEEMKRQQRIVEERTQLMKFIIDNIPFPIFVKDELGRYAMVNQSEANLFNLDESEIIGKDDSHFVQNEEEWNVIVKSDNKVLSGNSPLELPIQHFTTATGKTYVFKTTKIPFTNNITGKKNILGVSVDLTEKHELERKLVHEIKFNTANTLINLAGRQRMLSQKIGFYAEMLVKGKVQHIAELRSAIDVFEHSLQVIKDGGFPIGINCEHALPSAEDSMTPQLRIVEKLWAPYKQAANQIIYHLTFNGNASAQIREFQINDAINLIEETAEQLLQANNDLMLTCIQTTENRTVAQTL